MSLIHLGKLLVSTLTDILLDLRLQLPTVLSNSQKSFTD
jgi:hypothetical protein